MMPNLKASDFDYIFDIATVAQTSPTWGMAALWTAFARVERKRTAVRYTARLREVGCGTKQCLGGGQQGAFLRSEVAHAES